MGVLLSYFSAITVLNTADYHFCGSCHTMTSAVQSYLGSSHGGNNKVAVKVKCTDCHLPHESMAGYLIAKAYKGFHDLWREIFFDKEKIDWQALRKRRDSYTYSSGCIRCHKIEDLPMDIPKAFPGHRDFIQGRVKSCIPCHKHVGHSDLSDHIDRYLKSMGFSNKGR